MYLDTWLTEPPKVTTFRVNKLRKFDVKPLTDVLESQQKQLNTSSLPKYYFEGQDCLVLEQWPSDVEVVPSGREVMVDAACAAAVLRGSHVFAPGVIGLRSDCKVGDDVDIYGDLEGKCKRGLKIEYTGAKIFVGKGKLKMVRKDLFDNGIQPSGIAVETMLPISRLPVVNESIYTPGDVVLQNIPSIVCGWVVNAQPGQLILDMCASPGNKTTHLAEMSNNMATILAIDKTPQKAERIKTNCAKHGITSVTVFAFDSTKCYSDKSLGVTDGPPFPENTFDSILLDGPCSGLGQRPQLVNKMTESMLNSYKHVQRKLFKAAVKVLKVDGTLVYSTCTTTKEENELMVAWALKEFPFMKLVPAEPLLGGPGWPDCGLNEEQRLMVQRFGPENDNCRVVKEIYKDSIGFFIAKFVKYM